jgi:hypothetical protein
MRGARSEAEDGSGVSLVPRRESVTNETRSLWLLARAVRMVEMSSCSVLPIYNVDRYIRC